MLREIINLVFKGHKCRTIQMDALDYKGLKSKTNDNSWKFHGPQDLQRLTQCMPADNEFFIYTFLHLSATQCLVISVCLSLIRSQNGPSQKSSYSMQVTFLPSAHLTHGFWDITARITALLSTSSLINVDSFKM